MIDMAWLSYMRSLGAAFRHMAGPGTYQCGPDEIDEIGRALGWSRMRRRAANDNGVA